MFTVELPNNDLKLWHVSFAGAKGSVYEGEQFKYFLKIIFLV